MIKNLFVNPNEHRLRTGWRILIFIVIIIAIAKSLRLLIELFGGPLENNSLSEVVKGIFLIVVATIAVLISRKYIDKKSFKSLGLDFSKYGVIDLLTGFILSGLMIGLIFLSMYMLGYVEIVSIGYKTGFSNTILTVLLWFFAIGFTASWMEELIFRGYLLQNLAEGIGIRWAVVLSSIIFGVAHLPNTNSSVLSGIIITLITFLLVLGWLRTGQLWIPFGLHAGWNFFMGPIFGFPVSGMVEESLVNQITTGPEWITGGGFGPEGGLIVLPIVILGFISLLFWTKNRENTPWLQLKIHNKIN